MTRTRSSSSPASLRASSSPNNNNSDPSSLALAPAPVMASVSSISNNNSISYLAPFVASVLRDQVVTDLLAELKRKDERIQQQAEDRMQLELRGRNGDLMYCKTSMTHGVSGTSLDGVPVWQAFFDPRDDTTTIPNFIETVAGLELRLSGIVVFKFNGARFLPARVDLAGFDRTRDNEPQMGNVQFFNSDAQVIGSVGPILYEDYIKLPTQTSVPGLVRFLRNHRTINNTELQILAISLRKSQIKGLLPLLEDATGELSTSE